MEKAVEFSCSPFSRLPDDIVVQIYNKVMDLKTLCYCQLISKRLGLIVFQADTISFNVRLRIDYENGNRLDHTLILCKSYRSSAFDSDPDSFLGSDSFRSAIKFIKRFTKLKSICIQFPYVLSRVNFFKWMIKADLEEEEEEREEKDKDSNQTYSCLRDVVDTFEKVFSCTAGFPLLENIFIIDSNERGTVTIIGAQGDELRKFVMEQVSIG